MMYKIASATGKTVKGTVTTGGTTSISDSTLLRSAEEFNGGTIFFLSGDAINRWSKIEEHIGTEVTFQEILDDDGASVEIAVGDRYALAPAKFSSDRLIDSIQFSLYEWGDVLVTDSSLTSDTETRVYDLPDGVSDIRRVEILDASGNRKRNYYWEELAGQLVFSQNPPYSDTMYIHYVTQHPEVSETVDIDPLIDTSRLLHSSLTYLYGMIVTSVGEDDKMFVQLYNRESQLASTLARADSKQRYRTPARDPKLGW